MGSSVTLSLSEVHTPHNECKSIMLIWKNFKFLSDNWKICASATLIKSIAKVDNLSLVVCDSQSIKHVYDKDVK